MVPLRSDAERKEYRIIQLGGWLLLFE
jgi:hypothetical protein